MAANSWTRGSWGNGAPVASWTISLNCPTTRRNAIWIDNGIALWFEFDGSKVPSINREWVETLASSASSNLGLQITEEGTLIPLNSPHEDR